MLFLPFVYLHHAPQKWAAEMHVHDLIWKMEMRTDCPLNRSIGLVSARAASHFPIWIRMRMEPLLGHSDSGMYFDKSVRAAHNIGLKLSGPLEDPLRSYGCCNTNFQRNEKLFLLIRSKSLIFSAMQCTIFYLHLLSSAMHLHALSWGGFFSSSSPALAVVVVVVVFFFIILAPRLSCYCCCRHQCCS